MKVATLLLLAYLSCFAAAQSSTTINFAANAQATCATANGCSLASVITNLGSLAAALVSGSLTIDISAIGSGVNVNIDGGLITGLTGGLNLAALAVGAKSTLTVASGVALTTANFTVAQASTAFINGIVTVQSSTTASASFVVDSSSALWVSGQGSVSSSTSVVVNGVANVQGTITSSTSYIQQSASGSAQSTLVLNSTATANGTVTAPVVSIAGGAFLAGNGVVGAATATGSATVYVDGTVSVGNSPGTVTINGDWRPSGASIFTMEIASSTSYDKLYVTGKAYIAGGLRPTLIGGYVPNVGDRFPFIFAAGGTDGSFSTTIGSPIAYTGKFSSSVTSNQVITNFSGATTVVISALVMVACVLASML